jgi:outer membrane protein, heavy metal efflux system
MPRHIACLAAAAACCLLYAHPATAQSAPPVLLGPADYNDEQKLAALVWNRSLDVLEARGVADTAASEVTRARLYPNPQLDLGWSTIPIGETNPPDLHDPIGNVPNYTAGISELFEVAKRGPRQAAAVAQARAARAQALSVFSTRFFLLLGGIGHIAKAQARAALLDQQLDDSRRLLELDQARATKGEIAQVEVDRFQVEHARLRAERDAARSDVEAARAECAAIVGVPCAAFASGAAARQFLQNGAGGDLPETWSEDMERQRPEIAALDATLRAADEKATLARHAAIPDPTIRLGYQYDDFVAAGNQRQSLALGVQLPLPVANRGQADLQAALAAMQRARAARDSLVAADRVALESAVRQRQLLAARIQQLAAARDQAKALGESMEGAFRQGGASQVEVLLARRTYQELALDRTGLDADAYDAALKIREVAGLFPRPPDSVAEELR